MREEKKEGWVTEGKEESGRGQKKRERKEKKGIDSGDK